MKHRTFTLALLGLSTAALSWGADAGPTDTRTTVTYDSPEKFTDFKSENSSSEKDIAYLSAEFSNYIERLAKRDLPAGTHLEVKFKDINLAGEYEPQHGPQADNIRFMKDIYPPRMTIEFRLHGTDGKVLAEGERKLVNQYYTMDMAMPVSDPLRYDKELLANWMRSEFKHWKS